MFVTLQDCLNVQTFLNFPLFLKKNKGDDTPSVRLQPLSAKDVLLTKYLYLGDFTYEDVKQIVHKIDALKKKNFSPTATAAGAVYLYAKNVKSKKHTLKEISNLFDVAGMTIQRFIDHYKPCF